MMKRSMGIRILAIGILIGGLGSVAVASGPLTAAAEALRIGNGPRAWELVAQVPRATAKDFLNAGPGLAVWVAEQYRLQRRLDDAIALCNHIVNAGDAVPLESRAEAMLVKGNVYATQRNYVAARLEFRSLIENETYRETDAGRKASFLILDVLRLTGDHETALEMIERLRDLPDGDTRAYALFQRAYIAFDREDYDEAREFIEMAKDIKPGLIENLFLEARLNLLQDRLQDPELEIGERVLSTYVIPGRPVNLRMHDRNLAVARSHAGIPIEVTTRPGHDREVVNLLASPRDPTLFRATVPTLLGPSEPNSHRLEVKGGDIISYIIQETFQQQNDLNYAAKQMMVVSDAEITASSGDWVSAAARDQEALERQVQDRVASQDQARAFERSRDISVVRPGNNIYVQVIDYDRSVSDAPDSVFVSARSSSGSRIEGIALTETEPHSGIFRGALETEPAPPQASASDTAGDHSVESPISARDSRPWSSVADGKQGKWYAVDFMAAHPLTEAVLHLDARTGVQRASLIAGVGADAHEIASTHPEASLQYGYVDLADHFKGQDLVQTAGYLYTEVDAGEGGAATFKIGSCDGVVAWLNGERIHNNQGGRIWKPEEDVVAVTLRPGRNSIMMRVSQLTGPWGASLTILDAQGNGLATLQTPAPLRPGVVSQWHVFNRLTPENIRVAERVNLAQPVRIQGEVFRWVPMDVTPPASLHSADNALRAVFNNADGRRQLRWVFEAYSGDAVRILEVAVNNRFEEKVLPVDVDYVQARFTRALELGPGDTVEISYSDEFRVRENEMIYATMRASFHNATIGFFYDLISTAADGSRLVIYDRAIRYMPGTTDRLAIRVVDFDADVSREQDRVRVLVENSNQERVWIEAVETDNHTGMFVAILRFGETTGGDRIVAPADGWVQVAYADRENTDGIVARSARVSAAPESDPELTLFQGVVVHPAPSADAPGGAARAPAPPPTPTYTPAEEETRPDAPLVTSLESALVFKVAYPTAALRAGSRIPALLKGMREDQTPVKIEMSLEEDETGTFSASVPLRIGSAEAYTELDGSRERSAAVNPLYVLGGDRVHVAVKSLDERSQKEGWFKLASDASLRFTDRNYEGPGEPVHVGDYIYLLVRDADRDQGDGLDAVTVVLEGGGPEQELTLTETFPHSGIFTGRIKTRADARAETPAPAGEPGTADAPVAATGPGLITAFGGKITATYMDQDRVVTPGPLAITATLPVQRGDDGNVAGFTKRFADEDIAVRTRLLTAEALFEMAKEYRATGQKQLTEESLAEGRSILEEAIVDYPHTKHAPHAEYLLANLAQELEDYQGALARFNRVLSTWPDSEFAPKAQLKKGIVLEASGDAENAMDAYVELTYSYPGSELVSDAVVRMGQHFYRTERFDISGRVFSQFHVRNPENPLAPRVLFLAAQSFMKGAEHELAKTPQTVNPKATEYFDLAIAHFEILIEQYEDPELIAEALYWTGDVCLKQRNLRQAYMSFRRLTFDYPESRWARFARGRLAENAEQFSRVTE